MKRIVIINGSVGGGRGSTATLLSRLRDHLTSTFDLEEIVLTEDVEYTKHLTTIGGAHGIVVGTGTYWDSWGSPLQRFLEAVTESEGGATWLGKPLAAVVTMHSVGGKGVLSRLQGVFNTFGCTIPPMTGIVYSYASHTLLETSEKPEMAEDLWSLDDLEIIAHNLTVAIEGQGHYRSWPVDLRKFRDRWL